MKENKIVRGIVICKLGEASSSIFLSRNPWNPIVNTNAKVNKMKWSGVKILTPSFASMVPTAPKKIVRKTKLEKISKQEVRAS